MYKTFGTTKEVFVNQDEGMFVALPITLDETTLTLETITEGGRKYALEGSVVKEGSVVRGILPERYDITDGPKPARVAVEGYAWASRLTTNALTSASALPKIVIMPYKAVVVGVTPASVGGKLVLHLEGAKWKSTVSTSNFTVTGLTAYSAVINDDGDLEMTFTGTGEGRITAIASDAFDGAAGSVLKGLPVIFNAIAGQVVAFVGSYDSSTSTWAYGGTTYGITQEDNDVLAVSGTIPYAAADDTLGLPAGNRIAFKLKNLGVTSKASLPESTIVTVTGKSAVTTYDKNAFEDDGSLIAVLNLVKDFETTVKIKWSATQEVTYKLNTDAAVFGAN